jgi:predicted porin
MEGLGGGMRATFVLENGFGPDTGVQGQGNRLFGRRANVGLRTALGAFTLGRQVDMTYVSTLKADIMGPNLYSMSNMDGYLHNARRDNAIGYMGKFGDVSVGGTYSFGRDASNAGGPAAANCAGEVPGESQACRQVTALLAYDTKTFGVATAYDKRMVARERQVA